MWLKITLLYTFLLVTLSTQAQPPTKFYSTYGGNGYDVGYDVKQTLDGGYIITGSTSSFGQGNTDVYLLKLDSMGQKVFQTTFGGLNNEIGKSIVQLPDSSYVMAGYTSSSGVGGYDVFLVKADKAGTLIWQKTIGGSDWDFANSMDTVAGGGFIIAGTTYSYGHGNADGYIIKTDANGDTLWTKTYGGANDDEFKSVIQTSDGNYALTGYTKSYNDSLGDVWAVKVNQIGDTLWRKFYGGNKEDFGGGIFQLKNSNVLVCGGTKSHSSGGYAETLIITYDYLSGAQVYDYIDVSSHEEYYNRGVQGLNGSIANCGTTKNPVFSYDGLVDIYTSGYGLVNFFSDGSTMYEEFYSICKTKDKGFAAVGKSNGYNSVLDDIYFMKVDSMGNHNNSIIGVKEIAKENINLNLYPNPANNYINLYISEISNYGKMNYQIIDINGSIIDSNEIIKSKTNISLEHFSNGLYFIQIYNSRSLLHSSKISIVK